MIDTWTQLSGRGSRAKNVKAGTPSSYLLNSGFWLLAPDTLPPNRVQRQLRPPAVGRHQRFGLNLQLLEPAVDFLEVEIKRALISPAPLFRNTARLRGGLSGLPENRRRSVIGAHVNLRS